MPRSACYTRAPARMGFPGPVVSSYGGLVQVGRHVELLDRQKAADLHTRGG